MSTADNPTGKKLAELGITLPEQVVQKFKDVRSRFDDQANKPMDAAVWEILRQHWVGRKAGILTLVSDNWLKPASPELKRVVGQELNKLKSHSEQVLEER